MGSVFELMMVAEEHAAVNGLYSESGPAGPVLAWVSRSRRRSRRRSGSSAWPVAWHCAAQWSE